MLEHRVRLILMGTMLVAGFLPIFPGVPYLRWLVGSILFETVATRFLLLPYPCLILLNAYLTLSRTSKLKIVYRILLFVYVPFEWFLRLLDSSPDVQIGYWAVPVVVSIAALVELSLIARDSLMGKGKNPGR
jgi:hypothetical protein